MGEEGSSGNAEGITTGLQTLSCSPCPAHVAATLALAHLLPLNPLPRAQICQLLGASRATCAPQGRALTSGSLSAAASAVLQLQPWHKSQAPQAPVMHQLPLPLPVASPCAKVSLACGTSPPATRWDLLEEAMDSLPSAGDALSRAAGAVDEPAGSSSACWAGGSVPRSRWATRDLLSNSAAWQLFASSQSLGFPSPPLQPPPRAQRGSGSRVTADAAPAVLQGACVWSPMVIPLPSPNPEA